MIFPTISPMISEFAPKQRGVTLIELLVALAVGSFLISAVYTVYMAQVKGQLTQEASLELQQGIRAVFLRMQNEIRTAGMDPTGLAGAGILIAEPGEFHFTRDIVDESGNRPFDGFVSGPNEDIRYALSSGNLCRETRRPSGKSGLQSIMDHVDILNFVYLDDNGIRIDAPSLQTMAGRDAIRQVQITIVASADPSRRGFQTGSTDNRIYRNQVGDPMNPQPFSDRNRRLKMTTTIALRN